MNKIKHYIEACHICLKTKPKYKKNRPVYGRIPVDYVPMQDLSVDIQYMPMAFDQINFTIVTLLHSRDVQTVAEALIYQVIYLFGRPRLIICDEATEFTSSIVTVLLQMLNCRLKVIACTSMAVVRLKDK